MSGIIKLVHRADHPDGPFKTISEVAEYFERDLSTIRRWGRNLGIPTHKMPLGDEENPHPNAFVWLYTESDIEKMEEYSDSIKIGRPPKHAKK